MSAATAGHSRNRQAVAIALVVLLGGVIVAGAVFVTRHPGALQGMLGGEAEALGNESKEATMPATLMVAGQPYSTGIGSVQLTAPAGTASAAIVVLWLSFPPQTSPTLRAVLERRVDGEWTLLEEAEGQFAVLLAPSGYLANADLRIRVEPAADGFYPAQDFIVDAEYWA